MSTTLESFSVVSTRPDECDCTGSVEMDGKTLATLPCLTCFLAGFTQPNPEVDNE